MRLWRVFYYRLMDIIAIAGVVELRVTGTGSANSGHHFSIPDDCIWLVNWVGISAFL